MTQEINVCALQEEIRMEFMRISNKATELEAALRSELNRRSTEELKARVAKRDEFIRDWIENPPSADLGFPQGGNADIPIIREILRDRGIA